MPLLEEDIVGGADVRPIGGLDGEGTVVGGIGGLRGSGLVVIRGLVGSFLVSHGGIGVADGGN